MKAFKYKLRINRKFVENSEMTLNKCRELYNAAIEERRNAYKFNKSIVTKPHIEKIKVSYKTQANQLSEIKDLRSDLKIVHSQVLQDVLKRSEKAFDGFFRRVKNGEKPGYPRFKGKDRYDSFTYPQSGFSLEGDKLKLSKVGSVRVRLSRPVEGQIKTCTIKRECDGWYVIITAEAPQPQPRPETGDVVGIDLGLEKFATLSTGEKIENPRHLRKAEDSLVKAQQKLSSRKKGSGRRKAAKKIVSKTHRKISNQRKDFAHKLANNFINRFDGIAVEDLNVKGLQQGNLAKSISDASWSTFTSILNYKAADAGRKVVYVNPKYTSQECSACGQRKKLTLSDRTYHCDSCGLEMDRDHNAAINILVRAEPRLQNRNLHL